MVKVVPHRHGVIFVRLAAVAVVSPAIGACAQQPPGGNEREIVLVTKTEASGGGVLCCRD